MARIVGLMVARRELPQEHHVLRFASASKRFVAADGVTRLGVSAAAFSIRHDDEGGLSVTEVEHFGPMSANSRMLAACSFRESLKEKKLPKQGAFSWAQNVNIKAAGKLYKKRLRIVHDPVPGNPAHAEVRHFTDEDLDLLEFFATDVFRDYEVVADMQLPTRGVS